MTTARVRPYRVLAAVVVLVAGLLGIARVRPAAAQITAVKGSAFGFSFSGSLFGGTVHTAGPTPTVTLPAVGSSTPMTASAPTGSATIDPATFFTSGQLDVSTQGTTAGGSVTSATRVANVNTSQSEVLTASAITSTCTASGSGKTGAVTITGGTLQTDSGDSDPANAIPDHPAVTVPMPSNPAPNTSFDGHIHIGNATDSFRYVFNEQIVNPDGSITVNAAHQYLLGTIAQGDLIIGQSVCGVTGTTLTSTTTTVAGATTTSTVAATTTTTATTLASATTTTTTAPTTTTAAAATTTTAAPVGGVSGGAYGFFTSVSLFGSPAATRGPAPTVTLPAGGSADPVTASAPTGDAEFGPAILFTSDQIDVSTQGVPGGTVTSSAKVANVNRSGQEQLTAATAASTCTASSSGQTGSATFTGAKLTTSQGADLDSEADDTVVQIPANPAPNTTYNGKIENVGDTFRAVVNEQVVGSGSITVNAVHLYLLGPTAVGDLIIGQSRCAVTAAALTAAGGQTGTMARTGTDVVRLIMLALFFVAVGWTAVLGARRLRDRRRVRRAMPWSSGHLLR